MPKKLIPILILIMLLLVSGCGTKGPDARTAKLMKPITLNYWRVFDDKDAFQKIIANYQKIHPNVKINYRKLRYDEYEQALLEAFATDRGPDIFSIHNTWMKKYQSKNFLKPMPETITMAYPVQTGTIKKEVTWEARTKKTLSLNKIKNNFVDAVYKDAVINAYDEKTKNFKENVYGLPLFVDTLAMYYNKDLFNNAGIANPPAYWNREFQQDVKKMTKQNNKGELVQSGVGLGGSDNIERSPDILSVLMMQNGTEMMTDSGSVRFNVQPTDRDKSYNPGLDALRFYTDFANPAKEVYSWNKSLANSLDFFIQGKLAMMFGYAYMLPQIKANAPKMNFSIAPLPQIEGNLKSINFANYWLETVSNKSKNAEAAWDFIQFMTSNPNQAKLYLEKAKKPTALRSLVDEQSEDQAIGIFTSQVLTAKSWYHGQDALAMEAIMKDMIDQVISGQTEMESAINLAARKVQQTVKE